MAITYKVNGKMGKWENLLAAGNANNAKSRFRLNRVSWTELDLSNKFVHVAGVCGVLYGEEALDCFGRESRGHSLED